MDFGTGLRLTSASVATGSPHYITRYISNKAEGLWVTGVDHVLLAGKYLSFLKARYAWPENSQYGISCFDLVFWYHNHKF